MFSKEIDNLPKIKQKSLFEPIPNVLHNPAYSGKVTKWPKASQSFVEQMSVLWEVQNGFKFTESWAFGHQNKLIFLINTGTGLMFSSIFRKAVKLTGPSLGAVNLILPAVVGSSFFEAFVHSKKGTIPMALNIDKNHMPYIEECVALHLGLSFVYQFMFFTVGAVYYANHYGTFALPDDFFSSKFGRRYILDKMLIPLLKRNRKTLIGIVAANSILSFGCSYMESVQMKNCYQSLVEKEL